MIHCVNQEVHKRANGEKIIDWPHTAVLVQNTEKQACSDQKITWENVIELQIV